MYLFCMNNQDVCFSNAWSTEILIGSLEDVYLIQELFGTMCNYSFYFLAIIITLNKCGSGLCTLVPTCILKKSFLLY